jgi:two-component system response regulator
MKTILLVEDNEDDIDLTLRAFARHRTDSRIHVVRDGQEALDYLFLASSQASEHPERMPEMVLLDLKLPQLGGIDVLRRLRGDDRTRRLPVIILSSSRYESDVAACYDLGANSFIRKPVDHAAFVETARQLAEYWLDLNESPHRATPREDQ